MAKLIISGEHRLALDRTVREWQDGQPRGPFGSPTFIGPHIGPQTPDGQLTLLGVPDGVLPMLEARGIPFAPTNNFII